MSSLSLPAAEIFANFLSSVLYGIYLVTLGITGRVLLTSTESGRWKRRSEINWLTVCICTVLFVNVTLDLSLAVALSVEAFVSYTGPGGANHVFMHASGWQTFTKGICVGVQSLTADAILIYRCWFIWHKSWVVIGLPLLGWLANFACYTGLLVTLNRISQGSINSSELLPWGRTFWAVTILLNICVTGLIVWRIWRVERENRRFRAPYDQAYDRPQSILGRTMRNIIESGMLYTASTVLLCVAYNTQSTLTFPASALEIHSAGITFNLIIIRGARRPPPDSMTITPTPLQFSTITANGGNRSTAVGDEGKSDVFVLSRLQQNSDCPSLTV
ncbi:hypothetical protein DFH09DRAFT_152375 [Mycena vulgaris]|nr:hypothetical protein DFH09DRAFT_152375 [Mycena vulgaris]